VSFAEEVAGVPGEAVSLPPTTTRRGALNRAAFYLALGGVSVAVWQVAASFTHPLFLPSPGIVLASLLDLLRDGQLVRDVTSSYARILAGWALGSMIGVIAGVLMGTNRVVRFIFDPYLQVFRFLPAIAILPLMILWLGSGEPSKLALIMYATAFVVALSTMDGALKVEKEKIRAAQSLGASSGQIFWLVVLPATMPSILTGIRLGMGGAFLAIVTAEMLAANQGLGYLIANSRLYMLTPRIFVAIAMLGLLGLGTDLAIRFLSRRLGYRYQLKT
jgi:NitT/TauT family transport system permease protein